jgi:putative Holliday junction resolvase
VDWGQVRTGLALSDELQLLASPLTTLTQRPGKRFPMPAFLGIVAEHQPVGLVIGLPLTLEGEEAENAAKVREIGQLVATRSGLPCEYVDERLTTARALRAVREMEGSTRGRKADVDALAASVLLQGFLDSRRGGRPAYEGEERRGR